MTWTVLQLLRWTTRYLGRKGIPSPRLNAERLLGHALGLDRLQLYLCYDRPVCPEEIARFKPLLLKRADGFPLQYLLGETEFFGLILWIHPPVFIPRPETEVLVEATLKRLDGMSSPMVADVGTGSGNIAIALAHNIKGARIFATDISRQAISLARQNARRNEVSDRVKFLLGDLLSPLRGSKLSGRLDAVVSNPPYVPTGELKDLPEEVRHEDPMALNGGEDGIAFHRRLARESGASLRPGGFLAMEVGMGQAGKVAEILERWGWERIEVLDDLSGIGRVVVGRKGGA
ncbi:MAG TPA: peptide chain release factor N(5)-glutamine methyltransferase [Candidatus Latescibacteria bacterium]|nr:peptide chain release factor N(5)-glutamine methyltransferase [Candidatus Latescibacterota bacterium]